MGLSHKRNCATERRTKAEAREELVELGARPPAQEWNLTGPRGLALAAWETERRAAISRPSQKRIADS